VKRILIVTLVLGLIAGALTTAEAAKKKKPKKKTRTAESTYQAPAVGSGGGVCPRQPIA
jgi:hypothetical protein